MKRWELKFSIILLCLCLVFSVILYRQQDEIKVLKDRENKVQLNSEQLDRKKYSEEQELKKLDKTYKELK